MPQRRFPGMRFDYADLLAQHIRALKLDPPTREFVFHPTRKWRFDLAWPDRKRFIECDGGEWTAGAHARSAGMRDDCEKMNAAILLGWVGLRFVGSQIKSGDAIAIVEQWFRT